MHHGTNSAPRRRASSPTVAPENVLECQLEELRRSHTTLHRQVAELSKDLQSSMATKMEVRRPAASDQSAFDSKLLRRGLQFARISAVRALRTGSSEALRVRRGCYRAHSFKQTVLRSQSTDFTLHEFHLLASACDKNQGVHCKVLPSAYYAAFPNVRSIFRLEIVFDSYYDLYEALGIEVVDREEGIYREKKTSGRMLRAIQILGISCIRPKLRGEGANEMCRDETAAPDGEIYQDRALIVGAGIPSPSSPFKIPILFQESLAWSEDCWETGLTYRTELPSYFFPSVFRSNRTTSRFENGSGALRTSALNRSPSQNSFSLVWERKSEGCSPSELNPELVPGTLRSFFPAVVLRTHILLDTARHAFTNPIDPSTRTYLSQAVVSPPVRFTNGN